MFEWIKQNFSTAVVSIVLLGIICKIIFCMTKSAKSGKCVGCPGCGDKSRCGCDRKI